MATEFKDILRIKAPWNDAQLDNLIGRQDADSLHPYTCPRCSHSLEPFKDSWHCENQCGYSQDWAWEPDLNGDWKEFGMDNSKMKKGKWRTKEDFEKQGESGNCWIAYKGRVHEAYFSNKRFMYYFSKITNGSFNECYSSECITHVMPIVAPDHPTN